MAEVSKIKVGGITYDIKDTTARDSIAEVQTTYAKKTEVNAAINTALTTSFKEMTEDEVANLFI